MGSKFMRYETLWKAALLLYADAECDDSGKIILTAEEQEIESALQTAIAELREELIN